MTGKTILIVGLGAIGARTASLASGLGMVVEGIRRDPSTPTPGVSATFDLSRLSDRLAVADFLVVAVPLSRSTVGLIGRAELRAMKPSAILVNIGRGAIIDNAALEHALDRGWIRGAALDVFPEEPLPESSSLWGRHNVLLTAHYAGQTPHYDERALAVFLENLTRYQAGRHLVNVVDPHAGY